MTSVAVRKKQPQVVPTDDLEKKNEGNGQIEEDVYDEVNCLPKESCLRALADLRHSRWFCSVNYDLSYYHASVLI